MRGWERISLTDLARLARPALESSTRPHKFHAEPCLVAPDGTLFTLSDITTAEQTCPKELHDGTLQQRAERLGIHGLWFASKKEAQRYLELKAFERIDAISNLRCQVEFDLTVISKVDEREIKIGVYVADFVYRRTGETQLVIEDTKGMKTPLYKRSRRHFEAQYGLRILET